MHLLLDILHTALPGGNTCQLCNKSLQNFTKNVIPLPDATTFARYAKKFRCNWKKRRTDRITNGGNVLYLDVRMMRVLMRVET